MSVGIIATENEITFVMSIFAVAGLVVFVILLAARKYARRGAGYLDEDAVVTRMDRVAERELREDFTALDQAPPPPLRRPHGDYVISSDEMGPPRSSSYESYYSYEEVAKLGPGKGK